MTAATDHVIDVFCDLARLQARELLSKRVKCGRCRRVATRAIAFGRGPHDEFYGGSFRCRDHEADRDEGQTTAEMVALPDAAALERLEEFLAEECT